MLLKRFAQFILSGRTRAVFTAMIFIVLPFFSWIAAAIVALITLRKGIYEGFLVVLWTALPFVVLFVVQKEWLVFLRVVVFGSLLVWLLAIVLKRYAKWSLVLELGAIFGVVGVAVAHVLIPHIDVWGVNHVVALTKAMNLPLNTGSLKLVAQMMAPYATGMSAMFVLISAVTELIIGRGLLAQLEKGKQFINEWLRIRLSVIAAFLLIVECVAVFIGPAIFKDFLPVVVLPFIFAGMSLVHALLNHLKVPRNILILFYVIVILAVMFFPIVLSLLVIIAVVDSFINFRKRIIIIK